MKISHIFPAIVSLLLLSTTTALAATYRIAVPPVMSTAESTEKYAPLLSYLDSKTGHHFELVTPSNFMGHWHLMRKDDAPEFILDGSHLAAYRVTRRQHRYVARLEGVLSYSLVARSDEMIIEAEELLHRKIAVLASPNYSALAVAKIFTNPVLQPVQVVKNNTEDAVEALHSKQADAAIIPTPFVQRFSDMNIILTSEQMPGLTMTASKTVPDDVVAKVKEALIQAINDKQGKQALDTLQFTRFVPVDTQDYAGLEKLLEGVWGY